jgi:ribosomal protein S20
MLFDLRGKRRRTVQATYLMLAFLMGGGLVFFGIGGGAGGGLLDAFKGGGGGNGNSLTQKRIDRNEKRVARNPRDTAALATLVRDNYQLASAGRAANATKFPKDSKDELQAADKWWRRYLAAARKPEPSLATLAAQLYSPDALNRPKLAEQAALIVADATKDAQAYLQVVQFAALAGDSRTADLATQKAVDLAPSNQKAQVKQIAKQARTPPPQTQSQGG